MHHFIYRHRFHILLLAFTVISIFSIEISKPKTGGKKSRLLEFIPSKTARPITRIEDHFCRWKDRFMNYNNQIDSTGILNGLFLGNDNQIPEQNLTIFRNAGLMHLLSASGFNCWLTVFFLNILFKLIWPFLYLISFQKRVFFKMWIPKINLILGSTLFWMWSNKSPPINRATLGLSFIGVLKILEVPYRLGYLIFSQYFLFLIFSPKLFSNPSFHLTFSCLFGILLGNFIFEKLGFLETRGIRARIAQYFIINICVTLFISPVTFYFFREINLTGIFTNWYSNFWVAFLIMPQLFIEMILMHPWIGKTHSLYFITECLAKSADYSLQGLIAVLELHLHYFGSQRTILLP